MALYDRKVFLSIRFGGAVAGSLRRMATKEEAVLVKEIGACNIAVFPDLEDREDPDLARAPDHILSTTEEVLRECVETQSPLPESGRLHSLCLRTCSITTTGLSRLASSEVATLVIGLGGTFTRNFNGQTTHLITDRAGSEKHRAALRTRRAVVRVAWIQECWQKKTRAEELQFAIRPLAGLLISATGLSLQERVEVEKSCVLLGAQYTPDLTRSSSHLLAGSSYGRKFEFAVQHSICVVHPKWLKRCEEEGRFLEEKPFDMTTTSASSDPMPELFLDSCCVLLRGTTVTEERHLSRLLRVSGATRCPRVSALVTHVILGSSMTSTELNDSLEELVRRGAAVITPEWLEACIHARRILPTGDFPVLALKAKSVSAPQFEHTSRREAQQPDSSVDEGGACDVFRGLRIGVRLEEDARLVARGGGKVIRCDSLGNAVAGVPTHVVLRHGHGGTGAMKATAVTTTWLSSCLKANAMVPLSENRLFRPIDCKLPISDMQECHVTISGFYAKLTDREPLRGSIGELIDLLGATFSERMAKKSTTHLVCEHGSGAKYTRACEWNIPCVRLEWLHRCADLGHRVDVEPFLVPKAEGATDDDASGQPSRSRNGGDGDSSGLVQAIDHDGSAKLLMSLAKKWTETPRRSKRAAVVLSRRDEAFRGKAVKVSELDSYPDGDAQEDPMELSQNQVVTYRTSPKRRTRKATAPSPDPGSAS